MSKATRKIVNPDSAYRKGNTLSLCLITRARIGETLGGVERDVWRLITWLKKKQITYLQIFPSLTKVIDDISIQDERRFSSSAEMTLGLRHGTFILGEAARFFWSLLATLKILVANKRYKFSIIHAFSYRFDGLAALIASVLIRIPYTIHVKGPGLHIRYLTRDKVRKTCWTLEYPLHLFIIRRASLVLCESKEAMNSLLPYVDKTKLRLSPPPIPIDHFKPSNTARKNVREQLGIPEHFTVIGYVGRLSPEKNVESLVRAYIDVRKSGKLPSKLLIVGSGPLREKLWRLVHREDMQNNILLLGKRDDVDKILNAIDIFVLPSFYEGYSSALIEAIAAEKAIIASDIPSNREILGENGALFFNSTDINALQHALLKLFNDSKLRRKLMSKANQLAQRYNIDHVCEEFLQELSKCSTNIR